jgi:uncharacterized membrane protein YkgB
VIKKPRERGGHSPHWAAEPEKQLVDNPIAVFIIVVVVVVVVVVAQKKYLCVSVCVSNQLDVTLLSFFVLAPLHVSGVVCPSSGVNLLHGQPLALSNECVVCGVASGG